MTQVIAGATPTQEQLLSNANALVMALKEKLAEAEFLHTRLAEMASTAESKLADVAAHATAALSAKTQINDDQAVIAIKSSQIQDAQAHADTVRTELDRLQIVATQKATEAEGLRQRAQTATDAASEILTEIQSHRRAVEADATSAANYRDTAKAATEVSKMLADKAEVVKSTITAYEQRLVDLEAKSKEQLETITGLLPGATAAGLAHAFDVRRQTFLKPGNRWQWLFIGSVACIVILALCGLWQVYQSGAPLTWDELARLWVARLPIVGALVWLALHASREAALAKRLEEDYGYKATIAASFQGFHKQMAEIGSTTSESSPLGRLCGDTLATIASPPSRIYERHKLTATPAGELAAAAAQVVGQDTTKK